jgi:hypothetical protein
MADISSSAEAVQQPFKPRLAVRVGRIGAVVAALFTFILALEMLKTGAAGAGVVLRTLHVRGMVNTLGFGWLAAYLVMSGSPVAAVALGFFSGGTLSPLETFAMICGSRFGASFIVLFTGFLYYLRGIRGRGVVSMGVLSMVTTASVYIPAGLLGAYALQQRWLASIHVASPRGFGSILGVIYDPIVDMAASYLPRGIVLIAGVGLLLVAFRLFDRALPHMDSDLLETRWGRWLERPRAMFALGLLVTSVTLSVSASLSLLVPLAGRGYVKRENVIPYIMGANITTFVDTLVAALLLQAPYAFTIVLTLMLAVALVSGLVLRFAYPPYQRALLRFNELVTAGRVGFALFVFFLGTIPLALFLL